MAAPIPGYTYLEKLYESSRTVVFRARNIDSNSTEIVKLLREALPDERSLARFRHECEMLERVQGPGVVEFRRLLQRLHGAALVFEDFGAEALSRRLSERHFDLEEFLQLAVGICEGLGGVHARGVIHNDINPSNIVWNPQTGEVKLIDFGLSAALHQQWSDPEGPSHSTGTLAYMSPEQTGRTNRRVDHRSDLYSLGATFYEMLTGQKLFAAEDDLTIFHCHLAVRPTPPHEVCPGVPETLSRIVMRLLRKPAEERYQSVHGLRCDLQRCLEELETHGSISSFQLGEFDIPSDLRISEKLYGRQEELAILEEAFAEAGRGEAQLVLIAGPSGMGKSTLARELYRPATRERAFFARAKFDQQQRDRPFGAWSDALDALLGKLLSASEVELMRWKERIDAALGADAALLIGLIPRLQSLVGEHPALTPSNPQETKRRMQAAIRNFLEVFSEEGRPVVLFLDDLQWADLASLELLLSLLDDATEHLLLVGAYRSDEIDDAHPLHDLLKTLEHIHVPVCRLTLTALDIDQAGELLADTFRCEPARVAALAESVHLKTSGNPYFIRRFVESLHAEGLVWFDDERGRWDWSLEAIAARQLSDNVVDLLVEQLRGLPESTRRGLELAALLGSKFDLEVLATVLDEPIERTYEAIKAAIDRGILQVRSPEELAEPTDLDAPVVVRRLAFAHDRVREAAGELLPTDERPEAHLRIGRLLSNRIRQSPSTVTLFDVVGHLNQAQSLIDSSEERLEVARLNAKAARRSLDSVAFASAAGFAERGEAMLPEDIWQVDAGLAFRLRRLRADAESLLGHFDHSKALIDEALEHLDAPVERAEMYRLLVRQYTSQLDLERAGEAAGAGLEALGLDFPRKEDLDAAVERHFERMQAKLGDRDITALDEVAHVEHPEKETAMQLLGTYQPAAGVTDQRLLLLDGLMVLDLTLDIGVRPQSAFGVVGYAMLLVARGEYEEANRAGSLALELAERFGDEANMTHIGFIAGGMITFWTRPFEESVAILEAAYRAGARSGNLQLGAYARTTSIYQRIYGGANLEELQPECAKVLAQGQQISDVVAIDHASAVNHTLVQLRQLELDAFTTGEDLTWGDDLVAELRTRGNWPVLYSFLTQRGLLHLLYDRPARALEDLEAAGERVGALLGTVDVAVRPFLAALTRLVLSHDADEGARRAHLNAAERELERLERWSEQCPANFAPMRLLVEAELARSRGEFGDAIDRFEQAAREAGKHDRRLLEAIAHERAAELWRARGRDRFARIHLQEAHYGYRRWGARQKTAQLEAAFPAAFGEHDAAIDRADRSRSSSSDNTHVDIDAVFRAAESIARNLELEELLTGLMQVTIANAGAQRGAFLLATDGPLRVAVEGRAEAQPRLLDPQLPLSKWEGGARAPIRYVLRTRDDLVLDSAIEDPRFQNDRYVREHDLRSVLCMPIEEAGELSGILYLENNLTEDAFTRQRLAVLRILAGQIAVSLGKARLYDAVSEEKERFRQLAENIREVFWLMDWPSREIVYVSPTYASTWGRALPDTPITLDQWLGAVSEEDRERVERELGEQAATGEYDIIYQIERPSGARRWIRDRGFPIRRPDGQTYRIAGVAEDITRQHEVEQMKDEFISVVSHELRTPLTPIKGIFDIMSRHNVIEETSDLERMVDLGLRNSRRLLRLIDDLLDIQNLSLSNIHFENVILDVRETVEEAIQVSEPAAQDKSISLELTVDGEDMRIEADRDRVVQMLTNLISNAIKFSEPDGRVELSVQRAESRVRISVRDYGPGVPEEARERIFDKFVQADSSLTRKHGGAGLGLTIVKAIVDRLGGTISLHSEINCGTTFDVELPLIESESAHPRQD